MRDSPLRLRSAFRSGRSSAIALGWRMTFVGVAVISAAAGVGLLAGLPARAGAGMVTATLRERVRVMRQPRVAPTLLVTTAWAVGTYTVYSFIASFLAMATPLRGPQVGYALFLWGASAGVGVIIGGNATDKLDARADRPLAQCILHVSGLLARRRGGWLHAPARDGDGPRLGWRCVRTGCPDTLSQDSRRHAGAGNART